MEIADVLFWVCAGAVALIGAVCARIAVVQWWTPLQLKRCFNSQGIKGPPYKFFFGNALDISRLLSEAQSAPPISPVSHDIFHRVSPHFHTWSQLYGKEFVFWFGNKARLYVQKPEHIKEILADKSGRLSLRVPNANPLARNLVSRGLVGLQGQKWALHRKLLNPAFHFDRLKGMIPAIRESCRLKLEEWSRAVNEGAAELDMLKEFRILTGDVIARTAFGSSFRQGKHIFDLQTEQMMLSIKLFRTIYIPGFRFLPTETNRKCWKIENEIRKGLKVLIASREKSENLGDDLLGLMLSASKNNQQQLSIEEVVDECKTFYFAGHETTAVLLSWVMILLGMHEEWQIQARNEVLHVIGKDNYPTADTIGRLNTTMGQRRASQKRNNERSKGNDRRQLTSAQNKGIINENDGEKRQKKRSQTEARQKTGIIDRREDSEKDNAITGQRVITIIEHLFIEGFCSATYEFHQAIAIAVTSFPVI